MIRVRALDEQRWVTALGASAREVWAYRELLFFLAWRDLKVRYKQTVLGASWAILQPLFTMAVFSIFLGVLAGVPSDGIPYPIFVYCGLLPWQLFAFALSGSAGSLIGNVAFALSIGRSRADRSSAGGRFLERRSGPGRPSACRSCAQVP